MVGWKMLYVRMVVRANGDMEKRYYAVLIRFHIDITHAFAGIDLFWLHQLANICSIRNYFS